MCVQTIRVIFLYSTDNARFMTYFSIICRADSWSRGTWRININQDYVVGEDGKVCDKMYSVTNHVSPLKDFLLRLVL